VHWSEYLDSVFAAGDGRLAAVAVAAGERHLHSDRRRPLHAIRYRAEADELEVVVGAGRGAALRYLISAPQSIVVEELAHAKVLRVADDSGVQTDIQVSDLSPERPTAGPVLERTRRPICLPRIS
jgi:hypothetical protein